LNPNVPWKTRGNGAVCLRLNVENAVESDIREAVIRVVEEQAKFECNNTNPGIVFIEGKIPKDFTCFSDRVVGGIVTLDETLALLEEHGGSAVGYKNMRGIIGALAAVGGLHSGDHTYEILTYRTQENRGKKRRLDEDSVKYMDAKLGDVTFNNVDTETGRILIAPHGPDPVFFGIRGETPEAVHKAFTFLKMMEPVERWVIFKSNQGTDAHLKQNPSLHDLKPFYPAAVMGEVTKDPWTIQGGHVIFCLGNDFVNIDCAAYEPTGDFRKKIRGLIKGDQVRAFGGIHLRKDDSRFTLNLEKLELLSMARRKFMMNPLCSICNGRMESMGRQKGFRCRKCGHRNSNLERVEIEVIRNLKPGLYIPPPKAQRHLTKPSMRYGREKKGVVQETLYEPWYWPCARVHVT
jgi:tRNA(Ile2)-agmatinylcytidine synthase